MPGRKGLRWGIVLSIFASTTINYIDRQALSVAAPVIKEDLSLNNEEYSWIVTAFLFAYALMQIISGSLVDRIGTKKGFSLAVVWWSIANMLHALSSGLMSLGIMRFLLGMGEAANYPAAMKAISEWFPSKEKSKAVGILNMGPGLGAVIAPPLMVALMLSIGWKAAFVATGLLGFIWLIFWRKIYYKPEKHPAISQEELALIQENKEVQTHIKKKWWEYLRYKEVWGLTLSRFVSDGAFYFFVFWLPSYLMEARNMDLVEVGLFAWIPFLMADAGSIAGGWTGAWFISRGDSLDRSRKKVIWIGALFVIPVLFCLYVESVYAAIALISFALFSTQFKQSSLFTLPIDLFSEKEAAYVWGMSGSAGSFGAMLFTPLVGWMVENISYTPVFVSVAFLHVFSAILVMVFIPKIKRIDDFK
ncbi:MAG: MFS transporter [Bacteroidota bacterium]